ncbi:serine/threonine-protein kinase [Streptomyces caatingaensis]|uniref:serine/threonine-protein kinase n=1 Tax=Streptomyces caatingaensis TaxID=1678637 RepID=UPI00069FA464|nr:serine/threonine-protein kinase [Streptomyces caatingaensis]
MDTDGGDGRAPLLAGRYRLVARLGSGGMGVVWRAFDEVLGREVAVKEVRAPQHVREADVRVLYARLVQEARAAARIAHRCVITVHDVVEQEGRPWIVMELVRGRSLADVLEHEGTLDPREAARVGSAVLGALRAAHAAGVLHRDVKPGNVLLEDEGRVVLTDFGIALVEGTGTLTRTGDVIGSPDYLAPERALGRRPGTPSDLWSLGATLYAAVEGVSPFHRTSALGTLQAVVHAPPPPPHRAGPLAPLLEGLLVKDPDTRMGSAQAQRLLDAVASGRTPEPPDRPGRPSGYVPTFPDVGAAAPPGREPDAGAGPDPARTPTYVPPPHPSPAVSPNGAAGKGTSPPGTQAPAPAGRADREPGPTAHGAWPPGPRAHHPAGTAPTVPAYGVRPPSAPSAGTPPTPPTPTAFPADPGEPAGFRAGPGGPGGPDPVHAHGATPFPGAPFPGAPVPRPGRRPARRLVAPVLAVLIVGGGIAAALSAGDHGGGGPGPAGGGSSPSASPAPATTASASDGPASAPSTRAPAPASEETPEATAPCPGGWVSTCSPY